MERLFLSHSSLDKPFVRMVASDIKAVKLQVWLDEVELKVGDSLILKISEAIGEAKYVIAFLSENSINSNWVRKELAVAATIGVDENRVFLLPVLLGKIDNREIPTFLRDQIYIDFRQPVNYDSAFTKLLHRLKPNAVPEKILSIDSIRVEQLVGIAHDREMHEWIADYLIGTLPHRIDQTERYWSYIALAQINNKKAEVALQNGLKIETDGFALLGVEEGLSMISLKNKYKEIKNVE